ncbi:MAG: CARDB domain-containing protein, partial [Thermoplasmata archaeon]
TSDTGELKVIRGGMPGTKYFLANSTRSFMVTGYLNGRTFSGSGLNLSTPNFFGAFVATAFNDTLQNSTSYALKMVTVAKNTNQSFWYNTTSKDWCLDYIGEAPVVTNATHSSTPTVVWQNNTKIVEVYMQNGTWELVRDCDRFCFYADLPNVNVSLYPDINAPLLMKKYNVNGTVDELVVANNFTYPENVTCIELAFLPDLAVSEIYTLPAMPSAGENFTVYARIRNTGPGKCTEGWVYFYDGEPGNGTLLSVTIISEIWAGGEQWVNSSNVSLGEGEHLIYVVVITTAPAYDMNTTNNTMTLPMTVPEIGILPIVLLSSSILIFAVRLKLLPKHSQEFSALR